MLDLLIKDSPSLQDVEDSFSGFVHRVQRSLFRWGVPKLEYDDQLLKKAHQHSLTLLRKYASPSCFKGAAALTLGIVSAKPFLTKLPAQFGEMCDKQNAIFGILECVYWMHDTELRLTTTDANGAKTERIEKLSNQIEFSSHFFEEFVVTTDKLGWPVPVPHGDISPEYHTRFRVLALTFEALAYQQNGHCKYPPPLKLELDKYFNTFRKNLGSPLLGRIWPSPIQSTQLCDV